MHNHESHESQAVAQARWYKEQLPIWSSRGPSVFTFTSAGNCPISSSSVKTTRYCRWLAASWNIQIQIQIRTGWVGGAGEPVGRWAGGRLTKPATIVYLIHFRRSCDSLGKSDRKSRSCGHPCTLDPPATCDLRLPTCDRDRVRQRDRCDNVVRPTMAPPRFSGPRFLPSIVIGYSLVTRGAPLCKT